MTEPTSRAASRGTQFPSARRLRPALAALACALAASIAAPAPAEARPNRPGAVRAQAKPVPVMRAALRPAPRRQAAAPVRARVRTVAMVPPIAAAEDGTPSPAVAAALAAATRSTGADPALLRAIAWQESRFSHRASNRLSSARGLMQFTEATWLEVVRDFGARHGLAREAASLSTDARTGAITTKRPRDLRHILAMRFDPRLSAVMAAERLGAKRAALEALLGRPAGTTELYLTHLLGPAGARRFLAELDRAPARPAAEAVGADSIAANKGVFFERATGRALSLAEVKAGVARLLASQRAMPETITLAAR
ncbi:transglycosylase SLT domain-containing protein [Belnapia sp. F-4-1]|uniref:transglycosylase SLT domain-containing protein n=1 Tax=Belnapia sp. F-4-1 TaxID=1545443 RepID=UPI0006903C91|nr:transglycosylase SLT domain-containing protein [Belnapia sp. F-4-1]